MTSLQIGGMGERQQTRRNNPAPSLPPPPPPHSHQKKQKKKDKEKPTWWANQAGRWTGKGHLLIFFAFFPTAEPAPRLVTEGNSGANIYMK